MRSDWTAGPGRAYRLGMSSRLTDTLFETQCGRFETQCGRFETRRWFDTQCGRAFGERLAG